MTVDARGALLHPKPTVTGIHTAIVVGTSGQDLTTERDHRVRVQMHWQRGAQSASRRSHPQGNNNAPANEAAYVWVRVAEPAAGPNWGSSFTPRIGQEVVLDYVEGDIDHPVMIGSLYNGSGLEDAQGNQNAQGAGAATGNAPAWFAGDCGEHAHNAILSGFKTQEIGHSQDGQGGYNALMFDDSTEQVGARLQTTKTRAQLNLGHIKRQDDNAQKTEPWTWRGTDDRCLRRVAGGAGLAAFRRCAGAMPARRRWMRRKRMAHCSRRMTCKRTWPGRRKSTMPSSARHWTRSSTRIRKKCCSGRSNRWRRPEQGVGAAEGGGAGTVPAFGRPDLVMSAPGGVALLTPADAHVTASSMTVTGGLDASVTVGRNYVAAVRSGISLFTYGDAKAKRKDQGDKGIKLHAAHGKVDVQAQSAELKAAADKDVSIVSTHAKVEAAAKEHVLLTAGGAYIKIAGGSIQIHAPGVVQFKAGMKELSGPTRAAYSLPQLPKAGKLPHWIALNYIDPEMAIGIPHQPYEIHFKNGAVVKGELGDDGKTRREDIPEDMVKKVIYQPRKPEKDIHAQPLAKLLK